MKFAIIIPSRNPDNLVACVAAIMEHERDFDLAQIFVIDDGARAGAEGRLPHGLTWVEGKRPFIFARNVNLGILETNPTEDVLVLNDDAILQSPGGFTRLVATASEWGIVTAATNSAGNPAQFRQIGSMALREETRPRALAFVCVCLPRWVIERVGLFDERFTAYGWEDTDYCRRARLAGVRYGIHDGCFVDHNCRPSTFRGRPNAPGDTGPGRAIYLEKWGNETWPTY